MAPLDDDSIRSRIMTIRGVQVMFDRDLADIYGVTTKRLNEQVKRNIDRFPPTFRFALSVDEMSELVANCDRFRTMKHSSVPMSAFTEHGIIMLASVLKSDVAIQASIRITTAFVAMRKALASIAPIIARVETVERRQITDQQRNEERFDAIFKAMDGGDFPPQKVFFDGKHYDAYSFARKLVRKAKKNIVLVDNYCDDVTLDILSQKFGGADVLIATTHKSATKFISPTAVAKFNKQNPTLTIKTVGSFHDRFLILDGTELYHFGASMTIVSALRRQSPSRRKSPQLSPSRSCHLPLAHFSHVFCRGRGLVTKLQSVANEVADIRLDPIGTFGTNAGSLSFHELKDKLGEGYTACICAVPDILFDYRRKIQCYAHRLLLFGFAEQHTIT